MANNYVNVNDNSIDIDIRKKSFADFLMSKGVSKQDAYVQAHQKIMWNIANDDKMPDGKRRWAWVSYFISKGDDEMTAKRKACKKI
jgi:hypothetical protein